MTIVEQNFVLNFLDIVRVLQNVRNSAMVLREGSVYLNEIQKAVSLRVR